MSGSHRANDINSVLLSFCDYKTYLELEKSTRLREKLCNGKNNSTVCTNFPLDGKVSTKKIVHRDIYAILAVNCNIDNIKNKYVHVVTNVSLTGIY